jgi:hypothetical protein
MRLFPFRFCQGLFHDVDGALHRRLGLTEYAAMSYRHGGWLQGQ